ncbi:hypothetical protein DV738_g4027, partial [Chaetothyriales sp. CBS 135597]
MSPVPSRRCLRGARHRHGRAFYQAAFVVALLACYSIIRSLTPDPSQSKLLVRSLQVQDEECRQVRQAHDQCAFIKANCPDEEAGLISYLQLFYCDLSAAKPVAFAILVLWLGFLFSTIGIAASDFLCINLNTIAAVLGMSESLTGVTFLAFGNGSPDVFSTFAAMSTHSGSLAVGELIGAAAFISSVVAGSMAVTKPFQVARKSFVRDISFFAAAAAFSLVFLADGKLVLWECIAMVAFYLFYVTFVVTWHWLVTKRRRIRLAENSARLQQHIPDQQELEVPEIDDDDEGRPANERSSLLRSVSSSSFPTLLESGSAAWQLNEIEDDETRDRYLAELQSNMRVRHSRNRRNSVITPIRPSLMGALEFRSVLSSLEKRSTGVVLSMGRVSEHTPYSFDDLPPINHHHPGRQSTGNHLLGHPEPTSPSHIGRSRAVSADDTQLLEAIHNLNRPSSRAPASSGSLTPRQDQLTPRPSAGLLQSLNEPTRSSSPKLLLSPAEISEPSLTSALPAPRSPLHLAPPGLSLPQPEPSDPQHDARGQSPNLPIQEEQTTQIQVPILHVPQPNHIHRKSPLSHEFSRYRDSPPSTPRRSRSPSIIHLPPASLSPDSNLDIIILPDDESEEPKVYRWWPYQYLPPPHIIFSTFFPTLCGWRDKTILDKLMGLLTVPSVLLLTITLPVVDNSDDDDETGADDAPSVQTPSRRSTGLHFGSDITAQPQTNGIVTPVHPHMSRQNSWKNPIAGAEELDGGTSGVKDWNRWLVFVQAFTAPLFMVSIVYANMGDGHSSTLFLRMVLGSLAFSLVMIAILLLTTTHDREPEHRSLFCFLGFAVAIAWISTIANEVVGVLKTFGVILDISDAILGLTVFAIGNSLGDLVADITVAKLGYPVMALSACFGGPMLNILLGIGVSGIYMMIRGASKSHAKHPDRPVKYKPYEIEVSTTLMISGVMLLVTLLGLLIMVPLNGWRFDRKIGISLIALWTLTTIGNVVVEVLGYDGHWHSKLN